MRCFGKVFWAKVQPEIDDFVLSQAVHPTKLEKILAELAGLLGQEDYYFVIYIIHNGFDYLKRDRLADHQRARDYQALKAKLKPLARENKRLGYPFQLPSELLDPQHCLTPTARYYEILLQFTEPPKGRYSHNDLRHIINAVGRVLSKKMRKGQVAGCISGILDSAYGIEKAEETLLRRWMD